METLAKQRQKGFNKRTIAKLNQGVTQNAKGKIFSKGVETYPTLTSVTADFLAV
ncbi:hypothetical protein [Olivibacter sitiensis]|uniref:hypothetical protein n=1 Tax=Olivibacter sitiensis TaxID=376470 RepID=UPI0003FF5FAB|nr:hypothetical protein [Olivibacter sitiensis]